MPGICGVVACDASDDLPSQLDALLDPMVRHQWYSVERHTDPRCQVALGHVSLGFGGRVEQPIQNEDSSLVAMLSGEIYDSSEHRIALERSGHRLRSADPAEILLHGFAAEGSRFLRRVNGLFTAAIWDKKRSQLLLVTDRFGMQPLYYAQSDGQLVFATEIKALLTNEKVKRGLNMHGLSQFFTYGYFLGNDTFLEAIRVVPAATVLSFSLLDGRISYETYWNFDSSLPQSVASGQDYLERIDSAFKCAVDRRTHNTPHLGLSLSGGMDARSILGVMDHANAPLVSISIGIEGCMDHRSAAAMAFLAHCRHRSVSLDSSLLAQFEHNLREMVRLTDGHYLDQGIVVPTLPVYREEGIQMLLRGHAGELMHMQKAYAFSLDQQALALRTEAELEAWLSQHLQAYMLEGTHGTLLAAQHHGDMSALARDSLHECLETSTGLGPPLQRIAHLFITQYLRRATALSLMTFGSLMQNRLPYLDNDLIDILMMTPPELKLGEQIQGHILQKRFPQFLKVINANTGARVGAKPFVSRLTTLRMRIFAKLGVHGYQPYERLGLWLRRELRTLVLDTLLSEQCLDRGVFNPDTLRSIVDGHLSRGENHTFLLMALMIFEIAQQELFDGHPAHKQARVA